MTRLFKALLYSWAGLWSALKNETAFAQELGVLILVMIGSFWATDQILLQWGLISSWILVMIIELLNSSLEQICDELTLERRPTIKKAKDYGSAAVFLGIVIHLSLWGLVLYPLLF